MRDVKINRKKIKQIPKAIIMLLSIVLIVFVAFTIIALRPANYVLKASETTQLKIDEVFLVDTHDKSGGRMKLYISSGDHKYYLLYPQNAYLSYSEVLDTYLLSGKTTVVTAKLIPNNIVQDALRRRTQIVDIRTDDIIFFDIEDRIKSEQIQRVFSVPFSVIFGFIFIAGTIVIIRAYGVVEFRKPYSKKKGK